MVYPIEPNDPSNLHSFEQSFEHNSGTIQYPDRVLEEYEDILELPEASVENSIQNNSLNVQNEEISAFENVLNE